MKTQRVEENHRWFWKGKQDRHWYTHAYEQHWRTNYLAYVEPLSKPKTVERTLGTVTRVADTKSPYFNRWFAVLHRGKEIKSDPLMSLRDAKAWLEVIERMNR